MKKTFCTIEEKNSHLDGKEVLLMEGKEIEKKHGVKRMFTTEEGYSRFDNWDEWTIEERKDDFGISFFVLHMNQYSKKRKRTIIKGSNFLFIG